MAETKFKNTEHPITVGGKSDTGHTAKPIDPNNPPKRQAPAPPTAPQTTQPPGQRN